MKAIDYYNKHREHLLNPYWDLPEAPTPEFQVEFQVEIDRLSEKRHRLDIGAVFIEFSDELSETIKSRRVHHILSLRDLLKEQNQKWNALVSLFEKNDGYSPLARDYYRDEFEAVYKRMEKAEMMKGVQ